MIFATVPRAMASGDKRVQNDLERVLQYEIAKRKTLDAHIRAKRKLYKRISKDSKEKLEEAMALTNLRAEIALRAILADILYDIEVFEDVLFKPGERYSDEPHRTLAKHISDEKNRYLFFKQLYDPLFREPPPQTRDADQYATVATMIMLLTVLTFFFSM